MAAIIGWDVGGAHLKAARVEHGKVTAVLQLPAPLWQGLEPLEAALDAALARLGYYDGPLDGVFGPDTHAAIRRYQFELKAPMTGTLSAAEAEQLRTEEH